MRYNPLIVARLVLLSLQTHLHLLVLIAAAWNASSTQAAGGPLSAPALCLIFTSLAFFILVSLGGILWCLKVPSPLISSIKFECGWTAALLVLQLAATIGATISVPSRTASAIYASHSFLVPAAWLTTAIGSIYVAGLIGAVAVHKPMYPEIWSASASSVDWFVHRTLNADSLENDSWTRYLSDIESSAARKQRFAASQAFESTTNERPALPEKAPWAQNIRRGVDEPFALKPEPDTPSEARSLNAALPPLPLRVKTKSVGSRFIERFRDSQMLPGGAKGTTPFPQRVEDHDKPIPLPRWSSWIRADSVHP
ncbi:hypothetical protein B0H15DRAFT_823808 [Mycena belliarum]|uniref:Uncharacterized protein n=1 Tax=Mycena belliarum TaxID=1033014 RepID=A0AAD6XWL3_9AGAR|nr:hypothetical protein B0H15DRAFT_823808 [Mycena belliae]